jgi:glycogen(starch) synthase
MSMRILFLSNFYPPVRAGGYTQLCHEVAQGLQERGHTIHVLTSNYESHLIPLAEPGITRELYLEGDLYYYRPMQFFTRWKICQKQNRLLLSKAIDAFRPDVIVVWGMWALSKALPALAEQLLPHRVIYYIADLWPVAEDMHTAYWQQPARHHFMRLPKHILRTIARVMLASQSEASLTFKHALCVSGAIREILIEKGIPLQKAKVVHNGIKVEAFLDKQDQADKMRQNGRLKLLYAGQVAFHKGVHTAVEAIAKLVYEQKINQLSLTILGAGHPQYEAGLHKAVKSKRLQDYVTFHEPISREEMPAMLRRFHVLIFPSVCEEGLARITQEAMAAGLVVVGTTTGGTKELLVEGQNGLTFAPEDTDGLVAQIMRLVRAPSFARHLAEAGRRTVAENFTIDRMMSEIEKYLQDVILNSYEQSMASKNA